MQSIYITFNTALAALKEVSTKKYHEVCKEHAQLSTIETKLNCVLEALAGVTNTSVSEVTTCLEKGNKLTIKENNPCKLEDIEEEAKRDYAVLFGIEPRQ